MYVGWLDHGRGDPRHFANYVLQALDAKGVARAGVKILRGDPHMMAAVAASLDFKTRYRSGYLGFGPMEKPTAAELEMMLNDLSTNVLFPGFESDRRFAWTAIQHTRPNGGTDVHIGVACVDQITGKAFNPAPPNWQPIFDAWRDGWNYR